MAAGKKIKDKECREKNENEIPSPTLWFLPLLKKSSGNTYLKIRDEDPTFFSTDPDPAQLEKYSGSDIACN